MRLLAPLFIIIPIIEIYLLIAVGSVIGALPTILLIFLTAIVGVTLLRQQGIVTLQRFQQAMVEGQLPSTVIIEGVILIICGAFLLTPGFFTDTIGFLGLISPIREAVAQRVASRLNLNILSSGFQSHTSSGFGASGRPASPQRGKVIEGEVVDRDQP
ncbi:MAG: FxsA family protein [Gammaproteobacteria bacterium]|nr:FxsA family protein [Gammaproteobacteria bacterium]